MFRAKRALEETLLVNHKTMARWWEAVCSGDPERLVQVLLGRQRRRKLSSLIKPMSVSIGRRFKPLEGVITVGEPGTEPGDVGTLVEVSGRSSCGNYRPDSPKT